MHHQHPLLFSLVFRLLLLRVGSSNAQAAPQPAETIVIGSDTFTVNPTKIVIDSTTLVPGALPITINSKAVSIDSAFDVFVGGKEVVTASPSLSSSSSSRSSSGSLSISSGSGSSLSSARSESGGSSSSLSGLSHSASATSSVSSASENPHSSSSGLSGSDLTTATSLSGAPSGSHSLTSIGSSVSGSSGAASISGDSGSLASSRGSSGHGTSAPSGSSTAVSPGSLSTTASGSGIIASPPPSTRSGSASTAPGGSSAASGSAGASAPSASGPSASSAPLGGSSRSAPTASSASSGTDVCVPPASGSSGSASSGSSDSSGSSGSSGISSASGSGTLPTCGVAPVTGASSRTGSRSASLSSLSASSNASPGSSATVTSASATSAKSGGSSATTSAADTSGLLIPATSIGTSGPAATSQAFILGGVIASFASQGKAWGSSITIPAIKTQALNDNNKMSINAVAAFTNLGGSLPPAVDACGGSSGLRLKKRSLLSGIENLAGDVLGLAGCAINIASDLSSKIDVPPGTTPDFDAIDTDFDGLEQLSEEEENDDDNKSSSKDDSSTATSASGSSATSASSSSGRSSATSASSSSGSSSSSSSSVSSFSFSLPPLQTDGQPDYFTANLDSAQVASINAEVSASLAAFESSGTLASSSGLGSSGSGSGSGSASGLKSSDFSTATSGPASAPASLTTSASTAASSGVTSAPSYTGPKPTCMLDGAPWMSPTSYCDCGPSSTYSTLPGVPSSVTDKSSALCAYTSLNPSSTITPISTSAAPTNIPGEGGVPGCAAVVWGPANSDCPYASGINYCNCGGTLAPPLPTSGSLINCDYTIQPTKNDCPVNTAYSQSLASVASVSSVSADSEASVTSAAIAATSFNPATTSTSCGATFGSGGPQVPPTSVPRADTNIVEDGIAHFCTPSQTLTLVKGEPAYQNFALPSTNVIYQIAFEWDSRPECSNAPAPSIVPSVPTGPSYWCNQYLLDLLNGCDTGAGQNKYGGRLWTGCAIYEWEAFVPPSGFNEPILQYSPGNGKRDVDSEKRMLQGVKFPRMLDAPITPWKSYRKELKRSYGKTYEEEERRAREFIA